MNYCNTNYIGFFIKISFQLLLQEIDINVYLFQDQLSRETENSS